MKQESHEFGHRKHTGPEAWQAASTHDVNADAGPLQKLRRSETEQQHGLKKKKKHPGRMFSLLKVAEAPGP